MEDVQRLQTSLNQIRESSATQIRLLEEQLDQKQEVISRLESRLESQRDYEDMKRELVLLKGSVSSSSNNNPSNTSSETSINGVDNAKDAKDKRPSKYLMELASSCRQGFWIIVWNPSQVVSVLVGQSVLPWSRQLLATWRVNEIHMERTYEICVVGKNDLRKGM